MKCHKAMYTEYHPVHQIKISANVHFISFAKLIVHQIYHAHGIRYVSSEL